MSDPACIFCKIAEGAIPASVVHSSERLVAFRDVDPKAPVHILVIPREHLASLDATDERHRALLGEILLLARHLARDEGLTAPEAEEDLGKYRSDRLNRLDNDSTRRP